MDAFTTIVAPVAMTAGTNNKRKEREVEYKRGAPRKEKEKDFEEQFAAVYIPTENIAVIPPPTYNRPIRKFYA